MKFLRIFPLAFLLSACGSESSDSSVDITDISQDQSSSVLANRILPGENGCDNGGVKIDSGFDQNQNGILDQNEIAESQVICHGLNGDSGSNGFTSLIKIQDEAIGDNCEHGGKKILVGMDLDNDSELSEAEVEDTQYLCNAVQIVESGASCSVVDGEGFVTITCDDGTIAIINDGVDGTDGVDGVDGVDGTDGTDGTDGVGLEIDTRIVCSDLFGGYLSNNGFWEFSMTTMKNGLKFVTGSVTTVNSTVERSLLLSPTDGGYSGPSLSFINDAYVGRNGTGVGFWDMEYKTSSRGVYVRYEDNDLINLDIGRTSNVVSFSASSSDCSTYYY